MRRSSHTAPIGILVACLGLPVIGAVLAGRAMGPLLRFPPPLEIPRDFPRFSWIAAGSWLGVCALVAGSWLQRWGGRNREKIGVRAGGGPGVRRLRPTAIEHRDFPWWGGVAIVWTLLWWWLAWTRQPWFAWGQSYTFTPLWLGQIMIANALTKWRGGAGLMERAPKAWCRLFVASAAFWWVFEWLNRFVHNWHYLGVAGVGPAEYVLHSTLCFSTVLPAVAGVREWLGTMPRLQARLGAGPGWPWLAGRKTGLALMAAGLVGLVFTGAQPLYFYPALWAAPLLIGVGWSVRTGAGGWWREVAAGDWRSAGSWVLAALVCGFLWELWNWHSQAKWIYTVPFVQRWPVFEMPLLGYSGYLTFGLECALAAGWVLGDTTAGRSLPTGMGAAQAGDRSP